MRAQARRCLNSPTVGPNGVTIGYGKVFGATSEVARRRDRRREVEVLDRPGEPLERGAQGDQQRRRPLAGKLGYVFAIDPEGGTVVWKKPVGQHSGHDRDNELALEGEYDRMPKLPITLLPGILGGVETQMAEADGVVYAPIVNIPTVFETQEKFDLQIANGTGEMVALNLADGSVKWKRDLAQPAYGAATVSNDLVFTTTFEGKVIALDRDNGNVVWRSSCRQARTRRSRSSATRS